MVCADVTRAAVPRARARTVVTGNVRLVRGLDHRQWLGLGLVDGDGLGLRWLLRHHVKTLSKISLFCKVVAHPANKQPDACARVACVAMRSPSMVYATQPERPIAGATQPICRPLAFTRYRRSFLLNVEKDRVVVVMPRPYQTCGVSARRPPAQSGRGAPDVRC